MALVKCHECGAQVSTEAKTCPACGAKVKKPTSKLVWGLVGVATVAWISAISSTENANQALEDHCNSPKTSYYAWYAAQKGVLAKLKVPDDAKFADESEVSISPIKSDTPGECRFKVESSVTAQNSFGARLRVPFVAYVKGQSGSEVFTAVEASVGTP